MVNTEYMQFSLERLESLDHQAWLDLASRSLVPAGLARPELATAAFAQTPATRLAVVTRAGRLMAAMPVIGSRAATSHVSNSGMPLLDQTCGEAAFSVLLEQLQRPLVLTGIPATGPMWAAIQKASAHSTVLDSWERASLNVSGTYDDWFLRNFDRKRRSRFRRNMSGLASLPDFRCETLAAGAPVGQWVSEFLDLEAAGWKGKRGTALRKIPAVANSFEKAISGLHRQGLLRFWRMTTGAEPIAMVMAIVERGQASFSKIAYNERYAPSSPGVTIILEATRSLFAEGNVELIDSCAIPNHPMLDNIWRDRLAVCDALVAGNSVSPVGFSIAKARYKAATRVRKILRNMVYRARGWKPS